MKKNLLVLFGGRSSEHEVSCVSASYVLENTDLERYKIFAVGITKEGHWLYYTGEPYRIRNGSWISDRENLIPARVCPDAPPASLIISLPNGTNEQIPIDVAFPVLHGAFGEDGTVQGLFELCGLPYVGSGVSASAVAMDKVLSKLIFEQTGLTLAKWVWDYVSNGSDDKTHLAEKAEKELSYPVFVKPSRCGSSVGISKAKNRDELLYAIDKASQFDQKIVIEEAVCGKEIECAVLGYRDPVASVCGEIVPAKEFYDYDAKYGDLGSEVLIPAPIDDKSHNELRTLAVRAYKSIGCTGLSRVDFFLENSGRILLNEINTLPGFTEISMYPKLWQATGLSYKDLISKLIELALERGRSITRYE